MKISTLSLVYLFSGAVSFTYPYQLSRSNGHSSEALKFMTKECTCNDVNDTPKVFGVSDRRSMIQKSLSILLTGTTISSVISQPAYAGLLDEYGDNPTKINEKGKQEEMVNRNKIKTGATAVSKTETSFEPNLRSNYYYPTNKKRYLPRIKKCNDSIPEAASMVGNEDWEGAKNFAILVAEDTILPMKLYTSSLLGGGTNVKLSFTKDMKSATTDFEKAQQALVKAISKQDREKSSKALEQLSTSLLTYRTAGRLLGPDGGGDIPSVDEIRRSACRVQGRSFEEKIKNRDARLADAAKAQS